MTTITIIVVPTGPDRYIVDLNGRELCRSRTPLLAAARHLRDAGAADNVVIVMYREGGAGTGVRSTIGRAAGLTVLESERQGPVFAPHRPGPGSDRMARQFHGGRPPAASASLATATGAAA